MEAHRVLTRAYMMATSQPVKLQNDAIVGYFRKNHLAGLVVVVETRTATIGFPRYINENNDID